MLPPVGHIATAVVATTDRCKRGYTILSASSGKVQASTNGVKRMGRRRSKLVRGNTGIHKERANMSFMLVVMFFAVFGLIIFTEIFLIDDRHAGGVGVGPNRRRSGQRLLPGAPDRPDYEEVALDDYVGLKDSLEEHLGMLARGEESSLRSNLEIRLPPLDQSLRFTHAEWLPVTKTRFKFFVYSAYYDERIGTGSEPHRNRNAGIVRVIGATKTRGPDRVWCRLWYVTQSSKNVTTSITVAAKVKIIREHWHLKYSACFIVCPLPKKVPGSVLELIPEAVSIVAQLLVPPTNRLLVLNRPADRPYKRQPLAVCVKPLHYNYNRVIQLIEFIELHNLLGVSHITLYNDTLGTEAGCALKYYESKGLVTLLPWHHLDMVSQSEIRTEGLFAALNDCLYRSMYVYDYLALVDLDEFIIPHQENTTTILDLISWMSSRINPKTTGAYSFQNAFFYLQWHDDPYVKALRSRAATMGLITLRKTRRRKKLHPHKQRSKYVCRPCEVIEAGNHFVWEFVPGRGTVNIPEDVAILHHYRVCEFGGDDCIKTASVVDRTAHKYFERLAERVEATLQELITICPSMPLPNYATPVTEILTSAPLSDNVGPLTFR